MANFIIIFQSAFSIFIFFIANTMTNARFFPSIFGGLYGILGGMVPRMLVLGLPIYAIGILLLADAFAKNATLTGPTILFANIIATVITAMALDGITPSLKIGIAVTLCLCADLFLFHALKSGQ
jgi:hypothetical protein